MVDDEHVGNSTDALLKRWSEGDAMALDRLLPLVQADLRRIASRLLHGMPGHATLQTTALIHEMWLRLLGREPAAFEGAEHFLNAAARMMRQILINRARKAATDKRGGTWARSDFDGVLDLPIPDGTDLLALDQALGDLEAIHPRMAHVIELRCFVGLEVEEVGTALGLSERTVRRDWIGARAWLQERLDVDLR